MKKMGIYSCVIGVAVVVCMVSISGLKSVKTERLSADTVDMALEEESDRSVEQTEIERGSAEPYISPITDESWDLIFATRSFIESVYDYVVYEYDYRGDDPQREIVVLEEFEDPGDIPQTAIVISEETIDYASMERAVCAIEDFCGTDFRISDTYYVAIGGVVPFEHDSHEYTCVSSGFDGTVICDAVFEVRSTADSSTKWHKPDEITITGPEDGFIELREAARAFVKSAEEYVIYEYDEGNILPKRSLLWLEESKWGVEDPGNDPDSAIVLSKKTTIDYKTMRKALCAIEAFCGGTDFRIADTYYVGSGGSVQFEHDNHEYTCISEASVSDDMKICDAVFEVHSASGINITTPCVPDEVKVRDEEGAFQSLLAY